MTPRELQIAQLICQGLGNEEIANRLKIKHGTVKTHVRNLYRKLWVHNKILMLLRFIEDTNGLLNKQVT
jgi:DNA-binding NarL/FixJ family response regulator